MVKGIGDGLKVYDLVPGKQQISGGTGLDIFLAFGDDSLTAGDVVDGGAGADRLEVYIDNHSIDLTAIAITSVEELICLFGATVLVNSHAIADFTTFRGQPGARLLTADAMIDLQNKSLAMPVDSSNSVGTEFVINSVENAFQIRGGEGDDTITLTGGLSFTAAQRDIIFGSGTIEAIRDGSGVYSDPAGLQALVETADSSGLAGLDWGSARALSRFEPIYDFHGASRRSIHQDRGIEEYLPFGLLDGSAQDSLGSILQHETFNRSENVHGSPTTASEVTRWIGWEENLWMI